MFNRNFLLIIVAASCIPYVLCLAETIPNRTALEEYKAKYFENLRLGNEAAGEVLLEIGQLGIEEAIPFLEEIYNVPPESRGGYIAEYPDIKFSKTKASYAQVALATLGNEETWQQLTDQTFHEDELVRKDALEKIKRIQTERAIKALSNFIGDADDQGELLGNVEWGALIELTNRLKDPPYPVHSVNDLHPGYYSDGGREKWLRWRLDSYGVIPGREMLFTDLSEAGTVNEQSTPSASGNAEVTDPVAEKQFAINNGKVTEDSPENIEQNSNLWIWVLVALAVVLVVILLARKSKA